MSVTPRDRQGCRACRAAWDTPSREPLIFQGTNYERHVHLHQCGRCGAYWEEGESGATEISEAKLSELLLDVQMDDNVQEILSDLTDCFHGPEIVYEFANNLHTFRIEGQPPHWIYISRSFLEDQTPMEIEARMFPSDELVEELKRTEQSRWLFIDEHGLRDVAETFGRDHSL